MTQTFLKSTALFQKSNEGSRLVATDLRVKKNFDY